MKLPTLDEVNRRRPIGALQKQPIAQKIPRALKAAKAKSAEDQNKAKVRRRDKYCRFPLCGCRKFKLQLEVSHAQHKGAGGNPKGDRSQPAGMILLCQARHQANQIAVDRGTLQIRPLTPAGLAGPCSFWVDGGAAAFALLFRVVPFNHQPTWIEVARARKPHVFEPFTAAQQQALDLLAKMQL